MKGIRAILGVGIICLLLTGCASKAPFEHNDMERVAVLSLMGDQVEIAYQGFTVSGNDRISVDISEASLDQTYRSRIEDTLRRHFDYEVVPVEYDREAWLNAEPPEAGLMKQLIVGDVWYEKYQTLLTEMARQNQLDAILLLAPREAYTGYLVKPYGLGIYTGGVRGGVNHSTAGIFANMALFNGADGSMVEVARLQADSENPIADFFSISAFNGLPVKNLKGTDLYRIAKEPITEQHKRELGQLYDDLMADPYLADTVKDVMVSDWAKTSADTSGSGSSR